MLAIYTLVFEAPAIPFPVGVIGPIPPLRFEDFQIVGAPECRDVEEMLREYLVGRALADVDLGYLRRLVCAGNGECVHAVIREVQKYQHLFVRDHEDRSAAC